MELKQVLFFDSKVFFQ